MLEIHTEYEKDLKEPRTAKSFVPDTIEKLVLKIYYLDCQFQLDKDVACEIFKTWFEKHPEDSKQIEKFIGRLYKERFGASFDLRLIYSHSEIATLLKKAALELQSGKAKADNPQEAVTSKSEEGAASGLEEKIKSKKSGGDPSFLASKAMNLKQATDILKKALIPYVKKTPGDWDVLRGNRDNKEVDVFYIGVSEYNEKPGLKYLCKGLLIQFEGESSPLTVLDINNEYQALPVLEAEKQVIEIATVFKVQQQAQKSENCLIM